MNLAVFAAKRPNRREAVHHSSTQNTLYIETDYLQFQAQC